MVHAIDTGVSFYFGWADAGNTVNALMDIAAIYMSGTCLYCGRQHAGFMHASSAHSTDDTAA